MPNTAVKACSVCKPKLLITRLLLGKTHVHKFEAELPVCIITWEIVRCQYQMGNCEVFNKQTLTSLSICSIVSHKPLLIACPIKKKLVT